MTCTLGLNYDTSLCLGKGVPQRHCQESSLQRMAKSRLLQSQDNHWQLQHDHHHIELHLIRVVMSARFP
jgi:hypothetical protein